jgi:hypothetical protein
VGVSLAGTDVGVGIGGDESTLDDSVIVTSCDGAVEGVDSSMEDWDVFTEEDIGGGAGGADVTEPEESMEVDATTGGRRGGNRMVRRVGGDEVGRLSCICVLASGAATFGALIRRLFVDLPWLIEVDSSG